MAEWQPIKTAPSGYTGNTVLLASCGKVFVAWRDHKGAWIDQLSGEYCDEVESPTHWMPLPAPPKPPVSVVDVGNWVPPELRD